MQYYKNHLRWTSRGFGMFTLSFTAYLLLFLFISSGNFSQLLFLLREEERFRSAFVRTSELLSQLLLGRRDLRSLPKLQRFGIFMVWRSLFSLLMMDSQVDSLNFSLGNRQSLLRINELWSRLYAPGLSFVLVVKQSLIRFSRSSEQNSGILSQCPAMIFFLRPLISLAMKGGLNAAISYRTHPKDQISHLALQGRSDHTSGLAQQGVPVCVLAIPLLLILETLRSPNLISQ